MSGEADVLVSEDLLWRIKTEPGIRDVVIIIGEPKPMREWWDEDDKWLIRVRSPLLPAGENGMACMVIKNDRLVKFVPDFDS